MRSASLTQPDTRARLLAAAETLFREQGFARTTVADVARACEMSPANVYRFFESKTALREALTESMMAELEKKLRQISRERTTVAERLRRTVLEMHRFTLDRCLHNDVLHDLVIVAMREQWGAIEAHIQRLHQMIRLLVEEGARNGEFIDDDLDTRAECVFNAITPFCHPVLVAERFSRDRGRQAAAMADFVVAGLSRPANGSAGHGQGQNHDMPTLRFPDGRS